MVVPAAAPWRCTVAGLAAVVTMLMVTTTLMVVAAEKGAGLVQRPVVVQQTGTGRVRASGGVLRALALPLAPALAFALFRLLLAAALLQQSHLEQRHRRIGCCCDSSSRGPAPGPRMHASPFQPCVYVRRPQPRPTFPTPRLAVFVRGHDGCWQCLACAGIPPTA